MASMEKLPNSFQILKLFPIAALLIATPLLSSSLRSKYLYLIVNILIVAVGAEAGLLSFFFTSQQNNKNHAMISPEDEEAAVAEKFEAMVEKSPSTPSIFFIEDGDDEDEAGDEVGEVSIGDQELFQKAETFIGNFYKQLKMQREESWQKLHDIYHKAF